MKLNLGSGGTNLEGYINVDLANWETNGIKPDVISDVRKLPFKDNEAEEVIAIHVIEHFYRWEVDEVVKEWVRVLKPGGLMIIECPDLLKIATVLVAEKGTEESRFLMTIYGNPRYKEPSMVHKWGYTPSTMRKLFERAGLININEEKAIFHQRTRRDLRVIGQKPIILDI